MSCLRVVADGVTVDRTAVLVHGGAYLCGSAGGSSGLAARLSRAMAAEVIVPDYRLAPKHQFPAPVDDVVGVVRDLAGQDRPTTNIVLVGDSAGGGIALTAAVRLREADVALGAIVLFSPWVDLELLGSTMESKAAVDPVAALAALGMSVGLYLGGADAGSSDANPLHADLAGLPPMLLQSGSEEVLLDDSVRLALATGGAGVDVALGTPGWPAPRVPVLRGPAEAKEAVDLAGDFVRGVTAGAG